MNDSERAPVVDRLLALRAALLALVRADADDIAQQRHLAVLLVIVGTERRHTVRATAKALAVSGATVSRAMQRLAITGLAHRIPDPEDHRSVLLRATPRGHALVLRMAKASAAALCRHASPDDSAA